jgi:hypothetical protein
MFIPQLDATFSADRLVLVANLQPDMTQIYSAFHQLPPDPNDIAPYFDGYLGSHVSAWPEFRQLRGLFGTRHWVVMSWRAQTGLQLGNRLVMWIVL